MISRILYILLLSVALSITSCVVEPAPDIDMTVDGEEIFSGRTCDFGSVKVADTKSVLCTITNGGLESLVLTGVPETVSISGADASQFMIDIQPASPIAPGSSQTFNITFMPASVGDKSAQCIIPSNDPNEALFTITLTGEGSVTGGKGDDTAINLTPDSPDNDQNPAFSPDGKAIIFSTTRNGTGQNVNIWKMDLVTKKSVPLTDETDADNVNMPGSSWNGITDTICFSSGRTGDDEIWMMNSDGTAPRQITRYPAAQDREPTFAPDGMRIVFQSDKFRNWELYTIHVEALQTLTLTNNSADDLNPNWSPQGDKIVFQSNRDGNWEIYTMNTDGTGQQNITNNSAQDTDPSWSPDSSRIVYSSTRGGLNEPEIFVVNADGSGEHEQITDYAGYDGAPSFSPDGKSIAFESDRSGNLDIWLISYTGTFTERPAWNSVNDFVYQLQNIDLVAIGDTGFDLSIIDYSADGTDSARFTADQIKTLQNSPGGKKLVLSYMSIGEAEEYRWYWNENWDKNHDGYPDPGAPAWLGLGNPQWPGNYNVKYWDPAWQAIIFGSPASYLDKIIAAGFDGVYLDIIDAYEYWGPGGQSGLNRQSAEQEMVDFVKAIANYARSVKGRTDFGIFPQNGEGLSIHADYVQTATGIGKEDTWYIGNIAQPASYTTGVLEKLGVFQQEEKLVLVTDYVTNPKFIDDFYEKASAKGFIPYATGRNLDTLTINRGHEPD